ncbi:MAG: hypothetical protein IID40_12620, partial [Planctomycetes bacterium]|nr:hypothetical protein [Planctomycetota bacterium]
ALALLNGEFINRAVECQENTLRQWKAAGLNGRQAIERIYLQTLSRPPTSQERGMVTRYLGREDTAEKWSDVLWALINTREFMFIR